MGFQDSDPRIYAKQIIRGKMREWMERDVYRKLAALSGKGWFWDSGTNTLKTMGGQRYNPNTPWSFHTSEYVKHCARDHHLIFDTFGIIPPGCLNCWKVVATPETFTDLMEMDDLQEQSPWPCKCGIEVRDYAPKHYGAYFYNNSIEEGRDKYEAVKDVVLKHMTNGKRIAETLILKRGCTEYEMIKGPSPYWCMTPKEEEIYEMILAYVDYPVNNGVQNKLGKMFVYQNWALWAHMNADMSYKDWNGGQALFPAYVKYHEGDLVEIKKEIEAAKRSVLDGTYKPPVSDDIPVMVTYPEETKGEHVEEK